MIDLQDFLINKLRKYELNIVPSNIPKYNFQTVIKSTDHDEIITFLNGDIDIGNIFIFEINTTAKCIFLCFIVKKDYYLNVLNQFYTTKQISHNNINKKKILYDYASPNIAKDMHVGHLRSTVIGDCLANVAEYMGHDVVRHNHLGDFGLPFGMIVEYIVKNNIEINDDLNLQKIYVDAKKLFVADLQFQNNAYLRTSQLQFKTDDKINKIWADIYNFSLNTYKKIFSMLNISNKLEVKGESFYPQFFNIVTIELNSQGLLTKADDGRMIIEIPNSIPMTYTKSDQKGESYTYDTTDILALWYRCVDQGFDNIYYVVGSPQSMHFNQLFNVGKLSGWTKNKIVKHVDFGSVLDKDGKTISSRADNGIKLIDVVNEGIKATEHEFMKRHNELTEYDKTIVIPLTVGSIKYYDLSKSRESQYKFDFEKMLRYDGDTYTYLIYALARCGSIIDKINCDNLTIDQSELNDVDMKLLKKITDFPMIINKVFDKQMPHILCDYVYKLSVLFNESYTHTRCINFDENNNIVSYNSSRLILYMFVKQLLEKNFDLLGLKIITKI